MPNSDLDLKQIDADLAEVRANIEHGEAEHNPWALQALRAADQLRAALYPLERLAGFELMPTGADKGVMAVCRRHDGEVSALVVNSMSEAPLLGDLAYMAAEHEAEHHGGPAMPDEDAAAIQPAEPDPEHATVASRPSLSEDEDR